MTRCAVVRQVGYSVAKMSQRAISEEQAKRVLVALTEWLLTPPETRFPPSMRALARHLNVSKDYVCRLAKKLGETPQEVIADSDRWLVSRDREFAEKLYERAVSQGDVKAMRLYFCEIRPNYQPTSVSASMPKVLTRALERMSERMGLTTNENVKLLEGQVSVSQGDVVAPNVGVSTQAAANPPAGD